MFNLSRLPMLKSLLVPQAAISVVPVASMCMYKVPMFRQPRFRMKSNKHWNPKYKALRKLKVIKVNIPDFYHDDYKPANEMTPDEIRAKMKEKGLQPSRIWQERTFDISCTSTIFEPYVPPEGDGKMSLITLGGAKQVARRFEKKSRSYMTVRKIRSFDEDFTVELFAEQALDIYKKLHTEMARIPLDKDTIGTLVTERAYPQVLDNLECRVLKWSFIESIEPARVVHGRQTYMIQKDNIFAQLTVRFHTKQVLAVYDRFGRLCHGNPLTAKDVLEYVVFEKHLSNEYGTWRIHDKIIPDWMPIPHQGSRTLKLRPEEPPAKPVEKSLESLPSTTPVPAIQSSEAHSSTPQLQAA